MVYKKLLLLLCILFLSSAATLHAQRENIWTLYGTLTGGKKLDFNGNKPAVSPINFGPVNENFTRECIASVCDASGQLLFYTEGDIIWDKNGSLLPNGDNLTGLPSITSLGITSTVSTKQGAVIVPMVNNPNQYYVFSLTDMAIAPELAGVHGNLYYSIVDMTLNGGLGDVVSGKKGIIIDSNFTESMYAVEGDHCNYWLVLSAFSATGKSDIFKSYEITENGINPNAVISPGGPGILSDFSEGLDVGTIEISPDRKKLVRYRATTDKNLELFDFDAISGQLSNYRNLYPKQTYSYGGIAFSPNSSKLYALGVKEVGDQFGSVAVYQYDFSDTNLTAIINSRKILDGGYVKFAGIKRAPDGKIYYWANNDDHSVGSINYLTTINKPDLAGSAAGVTITDISAEQKSGDYHQYFPNHVPMLVPDTQYTLTTLAICPQQNSIIADVTNNASLQYQWNDNDTSAAKTFTQPGNYWVKYGNDCAYTVDTFIVKKEELSPVINIDVFELGTTQPYVSYQWFLNGVAINGATDRTYLVKENGDYTVAVKGEYGCADTSEVYEINNVSVNSTTALAQQISIYPNPARENLYIQSPVTVTARLYSMEGKLLQTQKAAKAILLVNLADGLYLLQLTDKEGNLLKMEKFIKGR